MITNLCSTKSYNKAFSGHYIEQISSTVNPQLRKAASGAFPAIKAAASALPENINLLMSGSNYGLCLTAYDTSNKQILAKKIFDAVVMREPPFVESGYLHPCSLPVDVAIVSSLMRILSRFTSKPDSSKLLELII